MLFGRKPFFPTLCLTTGLLVFSAVPNRAGQASKDTGSRNDVGDPPSSGEEGERSSPEVPGRLSFGGRPGQVGPQKQSSFAVGIVEANGNLVPVATYSGWSWSSPDLVRDWKHEGEFRGDWTLWYENRGPSPDDPYRPDAWIDRLSPVRIEIAATGLVGSESACYKNLALATGAGDRRGSLIECDNCCPGPMRGIATNSGTRPGLVERLDPDGEESRNLTALLLDTFNDLENRAFKHKPYRLCYSVGDGPTDTGMHLNENQQQKIPLRMRDAIRLREGKSTLYKLTIMRHYPIAEGVSFPAFGLLETWLRDTGDELESVAQTFCLAPAPPNLSRAELDKTEFSSIPIVFWRRVTGEIDILYRSTGWESEDYEILTTKFGADYESTSTFSMSTSFR